MFISDNSLLRLSILSCQAQEEEKRKEEKERKELEEYEKLKSLFSVEESGENAVNEEEVSGLCVCVGGGGGDFCSQSHCAGCCAAQDRLRTTLQCVHIL